MKRIGACIAVVALAGAAMIAVPGVASATQQRVGYYDTRWNGGEGAPFQINPIQTAGGIPVLVTEPTAAQLNGLDVLFVGTVDFGPASGNVGAEWVASLPAVSAWVARGGTLIFHESGNSFPTAETHTQLAGYLPGATGIVFEPAFVNDIEVLDDSTTVTDGPGGTVDDESLDYGYPSAVGYVTRSTLPAGSVNPLAAGDGVCELGRIGGSTCQNSTAAAPAAATRLGGAIQMPAPEAPVGEITPSAPIPSEIVTTCYPLAAGHVIYSTIPLNQFLFFYWDDEAGSDSAYWDMVYAYAPNVVAWGMEDCGGSLIDVVATRLSININGQGPNSATAQAVFQNVGHAATDGIVKISVHMIGGGAVYRAPATPMHLEPMQTRSITLPIRSPLPSTFGMRFTHLVMACYEVAGDATPENNCARRFAIL